MARGTPHEGYSTIEGEPKVHHGIGRYWCWECQEWVEGLVGRPHIDIISVDNERRTVYVAFMYYSPSGEEVATNMELPMDEVLGPGVELPDGPQTPWLRFYHDRYQRTLT